MRGRSETASLQDGMPGNDGVQSHPHAIPRTGVAPGLRRGIRMDVDRSASRAASPRGVVAEAAKASAQSLKDGVPLALLVEFAPRHVPWRQHRRYRRLASGWW